MESRASQGIQNNTHDDITTAKLVYIVNKDNISSLTENGDQNYTFESLPVERGARGVYRYNDKRQTQYQLCPY